jgi:hypothetical protein
MPSTRNGAAVRTWGRIATVVIATLSVVVAANLAAHAILQDNPVNRGVGRFWQKWQMLVQQKHPAEWLILGDSSCGQGVRPDVITSMTGANALNLCTIANATVVNAAWQLETYVARVGKPCRVILFTAFHTWLRSTNDLATMLDQVPLEHGYWNRLSPPLRLSAGEEAKLSASALTTLYRMNLSVQFLIKDWARHVAFGTPPARADMERTMRQLARTQGYVREVEVRPEYVRKQVAEAIAMHKGKAFEPAPENLAALAAMIDLAQRHGIELYVTNSTINRDLYAEPSFRAFYDQMNARLRQAMGYHPKIHRIFEVPPQFAPEQMDNIDHIVGDELAAEVTRRLIDEIRRTSDSGSEKRYVADQMVDGARAR